MDTKLPDYGISELDVAYSNFKEENKKIMPSLIDIVGDRGLYLIFASGYIRCFNDLSNQINKFKI
jgi:hypothetical protein